MSSKYAATTTVTVRKSKMDIEDTVLSYGADAFVAGSDIELGISVVRFRAKGRHIKFILPMPDRNAREFLVTPNNHRERTPAQAEAAYEQAIRQKWRCLYLTIKAKLESIESGIEEFEEAFMANIELPDGQTVGEFMRPQIAIVYEGGGMSMLLADHSKGNQAHE